MARGRGAGAAERVRFAGPVSRSGGTQARHRARDVEDFHVWTDTLPIVADWCEYGRHAEHPPPVPSSEVAPERPTGPGQGGALALRADSGSELAEDCGAGQPRAGWLRRLRAVRRGGTNWSPARERLAADIRDDRGTTAGATGAGRTVAAVGMPSAVSELTDAARPRRDSPMAAAAMPPTTVAVTIASPTADLQAATAKLLVQLRQQLAATGQVPPADGRGPTGFVVSGPRESTDSYGRVWYWFRGTLQVSDARCVRAAAEVRPWVQAVPGGRAAPSGGSSNRDLTCGVPGEGQGGDTTMMKTGAVAETSAWPLRPMPRRHGNGWECRLSTAAAAARVRRDLRVRLERASAAGYCTLDAGDDLLLAFEELTSNAFRHGAGAVDVTIAATVAGWLLVVSDEAPDRPPAPAMGRDRTLGGMGLEMVERLSRDFGWQPGCGRKSVWAELPSHR